MFDKKNDGETIWMSFTKRVISLTRQWIVGICGAIPLDAAGQGENVPLSYPVQDPPTSVFQRERDETCSVECANAHVLFSFVERPADGVIKLNGTHFTVRGNLPIPVFGVEFINRLMPFVAHYGTVVKKTNMPRRGTAFSNAFGIVSVSEHCHGDAEWTPPRLVVNHSTTPMAYHGIPSWCFRTKCTDFPFGSRRNVRHFKSRQLCDSRLPYGGARTFCEFLSRTAPTSSSARATECATREGGFFMPDLTKLSAPRPLTDVSLG